MAGKAVTLSSKFSSALNAVIVIGAMTAILVLINAVSTTQYSRTDLTEDGINSLSPASVDAVTDMEGLEFRLYKSKNLPKTLEGANGAVLLENVPRIEQLLDDKLAEYGRASDGNLKVTRVREDLEKAASAKKLMALTLPRDRSADAGADDRNEKYYFGLVISYGRVEETVPVLANPGTFEYDITRALFRLRQKQAASVVMKDALETGKRLNTAVNECVNAIDLYDTEKADQSQKDSRDEPQGSLGDQFQTQQKERMSQVDNWLRNLARIDAKCIEVSELLALQRAALAEQSESGRQVSQEHFEVLLSKIGWFDGYYGAWVASLIADKRDPMLLDRLGALMDHGEIPARTSALRVVAAWLAPPPPAEGQPAPPPGLTGAAALKAQAMINRGLRDKEPAVRAVALQVAIITSTVEGRAAVLASALKDGDAVVREVALDMAMRHRIQVSADLILPFLDDTNMLPRRMAAAYLINSGLATPERFRPLLDDSQPEIRFLAAFGLARLGDKESLPKLREVAQSLPPDNNRRMLMAAIERLAAPEGTIPQPEPEPEPQPEPQPQPQPVPPGGPTGAHTPGGDAGEGAPASGLREALGRAGVDRLGDMDLMAPAQAAAALNKLKGEINQAWNGVKDSPGQRIIGFVCGHHELCPFPDKPIIPPQLAQAFEQQAFTKKAVDDILRLEAHMNQRNGAIRSFFLQQNHVIQQIEPNKPIPENIDALVVYGPKQPFSDLDMFDVDQFILTGKPVVFFVSNWDVMVNQWDHKPPYKLKTRVASNNCNLDPMLAHYGVQNNRDLVMETGKTRMEIINTVAFEKLPIGPVLSPARYSYPLFPVFTDFADDDALVAGLRRVTLPFVSSFSEAPGKQGGLQFTPLIQSSDDAITRAKEQVADAEVFNVNPKALQGASQAMEKTGKVTVAVHVTGEGNSYFAGRTRPERPAPPESDPNDPRARPPEKVEELERLDRGKVNLVIIGSALGFESLNPSVIIDDFNLGKVAKEKVSGLNAATPYMIKYMNAWGRFIGNQAPLHMGQRAQQAQLPGQQFEFYQKNLEFIIGVFDWAAGEGGLLQIRAKNDNDRPLEYDSDSTRTWTERGLVVGLPLLMVLFGLLWLGGRTFFRRRLRVTGGPHS